MVIAVFSVIKTNNVIIKINIACRFRFFLRKEFLPLQWCIFFFPPTQQDR